MYNSGYSANVLGQRKTTRSICVVRISLGISVKLKQICVLRIQTAAFHSFLSVLSSYVFAFQVVTLSLCFFVFHHDDAVTNSSDLYQGQAALLLYGALASLS